MHQLNRECYCRLFKFTFFSHISIVTEKDELYRFYCALRGAVIFTLRVSEIAAYAAVILSLRLSDIALLTQSSY